MLFFHYLFDYVRNWNSPKKIEVNSDLDAQSILAQMRSLDILSHQFEFKKMVLYENWWLKLGRKQLKI